MNIIVDLNYPIQDGTEVKFRSPVDCSQVTGLKVYYDNGNASQEFVFADAHGNNVGDIDHLFAEDVVVKVILDVTNGMAFVQNADTNAYIERTFIKTVNGITPDENGNVVVEVGSGDTSVIDDSIVSAGKTWSSQKIKDEIANGSGGGGGGITEADVVGIIDQQMEHITESVIAALPVYNGEVV